MTDTAPDLAVDELLAHMVERDGYERALVWSQVSRRGLEGVKVADHRCGDLREPSVMTFRHLFLHLIATDNATAIERRGYRLHTALNVTVWDDEQPGHGPALGRGPA